VEAEEANRDGFVHRNISAFPRDPFEIPLPRVKLCTACGTVSEGTSRYCPSCGVELPDAPHVDPLVGKTIGGSFVVRELIGIGGMGRVYRGEQNTLGRSVAIKVIHPHLLSDEQTVQRFYTEARASSRLNHPNSVSVIDFGRSDEGVLYLVMEHLDGRDLSAIMVDQTPLAIDRIIDLVGQTLDALGEAHELQIVHRDLKPENVFVMKSRLGHERVKVLDFGLATIVGSNSSITRPGLVCGTPSYMSPEQARGDAVDARSDLYSVGAMLFELLTDRPPFQAETPVRILMKHVHDPVPDPRTVAPTREISAELANVVIRSLAKEASDRFQTANDMKQALEATKRPVSTPSLRVTDRPRICVSCGATNDPSMRYCGSCGARLPGFTTGGAGRRSIPAPSPVGRLFPFVGREKELAALVAARDGAFASARAVRIIGEPGMGASRLCDEALRRFHADGDVVARAHDHPSGVAVAYAMAAELVRDLLGIGDDQALLGVAPESLGPLARAGLSELDSPKGLRGVDGVSRAPAAGSAIAWAARQAMTRAQDRTLIICLDDYDTGDEPSHRAFVYAADELREDPVLWIGVGRDFSSELPLVDVRLGALDASHAYAMLGESAPDAQAGADAMNFEASPRALAQLGILEERLADTPKRELFNAADLAMARLDRLDARARRMLQSLAVLGRSTTIDLLKVVSGIPDTTPIGELRTRSLVSVDGNRIAFTEPFLADLVEAMIPAEARRLLHAAALDASSDVNAPTEVIAEHAALASLGMRSLVLLERAGDVSIRRGDIPAAVRIFRRGVDLARREALASGESMFDSARVSFGRKLGEAMTELGDFLSADGILREILDMPELDRASRARVQLALARVNRKRGRLEEATRQIEAALELVPKAAIELEAAVQFEAGELRAAAGQWSQAVESYRGAAELLAMKDGDRTLLAQVFARIVEAALALDDAEAFDAAIVHVERESKRADALALAARAHAKAVQSPIDGIDVERSRSRAVELACAAGDAETFRKLVAAH